MIWGLAGIVCTTGSFAYAELGTMFPESGGDFQYLARAYSKKVALVFGWSFITILNPIGTAGIAGVLGRYSVDVITYFRTGTSTGTGSIDAHTAIGGMCMLIVIGSMQAAKNHAQSEALTIPIRDSSHNVLDYVSALCFAFFAFNGFNNINLGLGELRDPERNLKRAVWIAMPFVTVLFLLANFAFFSILSSYDLRHVHSLSLHAGHTVLGQPGGLLMAGTVIASALGSINANIWAGSRLLVIMAKDNTIIPSSVSKVWERRGTQVIAISILIAQACTHALINLDFKTFSKIYSAVGWSWYGLSVAGLLYMRKSKPSYPRPVKVFWPLALGFVSVAFFLVFGSLTLAFTSSSKKAASGSNGEQDKSGAGKYTSVIMFGMAILFMLGVIPAFYLTRWYNRRRDVKHGPATDDDDSFDDSDGNSNDRNETSFNQGGLMVETARHIPYLKVEGAYDAKLVRRHSGASSITLVDENKRKQVQQRGYLNIRDSRSSIPRMTSGNENNEEEIARVQSLNGSRQRSQNGLGIAEMGNNRSNNVDGHNYNNNETSIKKHYCHPRPSDSSISAAAFMSSSRDFRCHDDNSHSSLPQYLDLPRNEISGSNSSETTIGLEAYLYDKEGKEYKDTKDDGGTGPKIIQSTQTEEFCNGNSRFGSTMDLLDIPLADDRSFQPSTSRSLPMTSQDIGTIFSGERVHPFEKPTDARKSP
ncbi:hypothetical protein BGZ46_008741 [Entomortierella lignicola]|nr:hypothetical protein BGZ46_008741 [Entomortierella lignicola]